MHFLLGSNVGFYENRVAIRLIIKGVLEFEVKDGLGGRSVALYKKHLSLGAVSALEKLSQAVKDEEVLAVEIKSERNLIEIKIKSGAIQIKRKEKPQTFFALCDLAEQI